VELETTGLRNSEVLETTLEPVLTGLPNTELALETGLPNTELALELELEQETGPPNTVVQETTGLSNTFPQVNIPRPKTKS